GVQTCALPIFWSPVGAVLAWSFTAFTIFASFGIGNMVQANSMSEAMSDSFSIPEWGTGLAVAAITLVVLVGGVRSISSAAGRIVPTMVLLFIGAQLWVLVA